RIKDLIQRVGSLEFRILANQHDDKDALAAARKYFEEAANSWKNFLGQVKAKWPDAIPGDPTKPDFVPPVPPGDETGLSALIREKYKQTTASEVEQFFRTNFKPNAQLSDLMEKAAAGVPPPPPLSADGKTFKVTLEDGEHRLSYSWVE